MKRQISSALMLFGLLFAMLFAGTACDPGTTLVLAGANVVTVIDTDKTLTDHAASWVTGEDCSTREALDGRPYCQAEEELLVAPAAAEVYCYRSIGSIVCYREPDPLASDAMRVH